MPKLEGPLFSVSAHGTMKDAITFQGGPSGPRVQKVPKHRDMNTALQSVVRTSFLQAASEWRALDGASKAYYNTLAEGQGMTGYNLYIKLFLTGAGGAPPTPFDLDLQVSASTDDCTAQWDGAAWEMLPLTQDSAVPGYFNFANLKRGCGFRFLNVAIPKGSTISAAYISVRAKTAQSLTIVNTKVIGNKDANALTWSTLADYQARRGTDVGGANNDRRTVAEVQWDSIPAWSEGVWYDSPEIKTVIQEIIDQGGWASGNALALFWDDHEARGTQSDGVLRSGCAYDTDSAWGCKLHIEGSG